MGGHADGVGAWLKDRHDPAAGLSEVLKLAVSALGNAATATDTGSRQIDQDQLEVAVLDRTRRGDRKFRRLTGQSLQNLL